MLALGLLAVGGLLSLWVTWIEPIRVHNRWYGRVLADIRELAHKRPPGVSNDQWEFIVGWTVNLHANCGGIRSAVKPDWRAGFVAELERRLQGPITVADIEWIWDEYARHTTYGPSYSDQYRPMREKDL